VLYDRVALALSTSPLFRVELRGGLAGQLPGTSNYRGLQDGIEIIYNKFTIATVTCSTVSMI